MTITTETRDLIFKKPYCEIILKPSFQYASGNRVSELATYITTEVIHNDNNADATAALAMVLVALIDLSDERNEILKLLRGIEK